MASFRIPYLVGKANLAGEASWYWQPSAALARAGWKAEALGKGGRPDAPPEAIADAARARNAKVAEWKKGGARPAAVRRLVRPLTLAALVERYRAEGCPSVKSPGRKVSAATAGAYGEKFVRILAWGGDTPLPAFTPERVDAFKASLLAPAKAGPRKGEVRYTSAHGHLRVLRTLFAFAEQQRLIPKGTNPAAGFALSTPDPRFQAWWEPHRAALFEAADASGDVMMAAAVALAFSTGQREGDLLRLGQRQWAPIEPYLIEDREVYALLAQTPVPAYDGRPGYLPGDVWGVMLRQSKTARPVGVPVVGLDRARLEAAIARSRAAGVTAILHDDRRPDEAAPAWKREAWRPRPWTMPNPKAGRYRFAKAFADLRLAAIARLEAAAIEGDEDAAATASGMAGLQFRDFRRTAAIVMAERGVSDVNIAAVTGWSLDYTKKIVETYVPRTIGSAARAVATMTSRSSQNVGGSKAASGGSGATDITLRREGGEG
ncbi:MAG: hypothetical protein QOH04_2616 [Sphingomonadales bacterium]|nr:hypothetical protein [Sphingomonadales bacterium]